MKIQSIYIAFCALFIGCTLQENQPDAVEVKFEHFVTASGYHILDGQDTLRFISWNIPNLNYVEDEMKFDSNNPYGLPDEYEIRDALMTIKELGGQVVRMYTIPVRSKNLPSNAVTYVEAPNEFNEEAFQNLDLVLALANEVGVRVIVPFLNNWQWFGGVPNYADFRDKEFDDFWVDEQLWNDFKATVDHTINRVNTITGERYIDDKAIFSWESGNELENPYPWVKRLAAHVKSIDTNHLFMDGYYAVDDQPFLPEVFDDPNIDIVSSHHYEQSPIDMLNNIKDKVSYIDGRKPYFIGEFGFVSTIGMDMVIDYILEEERIFGGMSWSIRHHHRDGGFYWHSEPSGLDLYKAFHWPGSEVGNAYDESNLLNKFRNAAFKIQNKDIPAVSIPLPPKLLPIHDFNTIRWQGSMGAKYYEIYRKEIGSEDWKKIEAYAKEDTRPYFSGFVDETSEVGKSYDYKINAVNSSGISDNSNIETVTNIPHKLYVSHPDNYSEFLEGDKVTIENGNDRDYKEMLYRLKGALGSEVTYKVDGSIMEATIYGFSEDATSDLIFSVSDDGIDYIEVTHDFHEYSLGDKLYNYKVPVVYQLDTIVSEKSFLKIVFSDTAYIGRVEIKHQ